MHIARCEASNLYVLFENDLIHVVFRVVKAPVPSNGQMAVKFGRQGSEQTYDLASPKDTNGNGSASVPTGTSGIGSDHPDDVYEPDLEMDNTYEMATLGGIANPGCRLSDLPTNSARVDSCSTVGAW